MTRTHPTIQLFTIGAVAVIAGLLFFSMAAMARADTTIIHIPTGVYHGSQTLGTFDTSAVAGQTCDFVLTVTNPGRPSIHNENRAIVSIDGSAIIDTPIERAGNPGGGSATAVAGNSVALSLHTDDVSSAGFNVSMECAPPPTTTTPPDTTTTTTPICHEDEPCWDCETMGNQICELPTTTTIATTTTTLAICEVSECDLTCENFPEDERLDCPVPVPVPTTTVSTTVPDTTSTTLPAPSTTDTTPIPSGVPTGEGPPPNSPLLPLMAAAMAVSAIGVGAYRVGRRGDDE
jgi:hypothetical protein